MAGTPLLLRVVDGLAAVGDVIIATAAPLAGPVLDVLGDSSVRVVVADPPGDRESCVTAALAALGADVDCVLLHDIEWPVIGAALIARLQAALHSGVAVAVPVLPVTDSVKAVDADGQITATLDRAALRTVQYPRGFRVDALVRLNRPDSAADDLEGLLSTGADVRLVEGDADALRVELPGEAAYFSALLQSRAAPR